MRHVLILRRPLFAIEFRQRIQLFVRLDPLPLPSIVARRPNQVASVRCRCVFMSAIFHRGHVVVPIVKKLVGRAFGLPAQSACLLLAAVSV
jgi:hypothetical protein